MESSPGRERGIAVDGSANLLLTSFFRLWPDVVRIRYNAELERRVSHFYNE